MLTHGEHTNIRPKKTNDFSRKSKGSISRLIKKDSSFMQSKAVHDLTNVVSKHKRSFVKPSGKILLSSDNNNNKDPPLPKSYRHTRIQNYKHRPPWNKQDAAIIKRYLIVILFFVVYLVTLFLSFRMWTNEYVVMHPILKNWESNDKSIETITTNSIDVIFVKYPISSLSFTEVRRFWARAEATAQTPNLLERVALPHNFSGQYLPSSIDEFVSLSHQLLDDQLSTTDRSSNIAIVSVCIGIDICDLSRPNHESYAAARGYDYLLVSQHVDGVHPKMVKYLALAYAFSRGYDWLLMLDADAIVTNHSISMESMLREATVTEDGGPSLILTRGGNWREMHVINNGVFMLKNTEWSIDHLFRIFTCRWVFTRFLGKTLVDQPVQLSLLIADRELMYPPETEVEVGEHVAVIPKRRMNSFRRDAWFSQRDKEEGVMWEEGDWIAHFASGNKYSLIVDLLQQFGMGGVPKVADRFEFLSGDEETRVSGSCWCEATRNGGNAEMLSCIPRYHVVGVHGAGTKVVLKYLKEHFDMSGQFQGDSASWLTDTVSNKISSLCSKIRKQQKVTSTTTTPAIVQQEDNDILSLSHSCSFRDYGLRHGSIFETSSGGTHNTCTTLPRFLHGTTSKLFDELVIWDSTLSRVRGLQLPHVLKLMQPSAKLLIAVKSPAEVSYAAYLHHFSSSSPSSSETTSNNDISVPSPSHFHRFALNVTNNWITKGCTPYNYKTCLRHEYYSVGSWFARGMYAPYLRAWLEYFDCGEGLHIVDTSTLVDEERRQHEIDRLYGFIGDFEGESPKQVLNYTQDEDEMNTAYGSMLLETKEHLDTFYALFNLDICKLISTYKCLEVKILRDLCDQALSLRKREVI